MQLSYCCPCKITKIEERLLAEKNVSSLYIAKIQNFDPVNNFPTRKVEPIAKKTCKTKRVFPIYPRIKRYLDNFYV